MPLRLFAVFIVCMFSAPRLYSQRSDSATAISGIDSIAPVKKDTPWLRFKRVLPYWDLWKTKRVSADAAADQDENQGRIGGMTPGGFVWRAVITYNPPIYPLYRLLREIIRVPAFHARHRRNRSRSTLS